MVYHNRDGGTADLAKLGSTALKPYRREIRMVFQDPNSSLNPRMTVLQIVGEPLKVNKVASGEGARGQGRRALAPRGPAAGVHVAAIRTPSPAASASAISIARALALDPRFVVADEAVTALDVSVRAQILNLLQDLQEEFDLTYLFISHDLSVVEHICDRVAVMYVGKVVEVAQTGKIFDEPNIPIPKPCSRPYPSPTRASGTADGASYSAETCRTQPIRPPAATSTPAAPTPKNAARMRSPPCAR